MGQLQFNLTFLDSSMIFLMLDSLAYKIIRFPAPLRNIKDKAKIWKLCPLYVASDLDFQRAALCVLQELWFGVHTQYGFAHSRASSMHDTCMLCNLLNWMTMSPLSHYQLLYVPMVSLLWPGDSWKILS